MKECTFTAGYSFFKPSIMAGPDGLAVSNLVQDMIGNTFIKGTMTVTSTKTPIPPGQVEAIGFAAFIFDAQNVPPGPVLTITVCANGAPTVLVTTSTNHGYQTGDLVVIAGVQGTVEANGTHVVIVTSPTQFKLAQSHFLNAYLSGGTVTLTPTVFISNGAANPFFLQIQPGKASFCTPLIDLDNNPLQAVTSLGPLILEYLLVSI